MMQSLEQNQIHPRLTCIAFVIVWQSHYIPVRNCIFFKQDSLNYSKERRPPMFILAVLICLALFAFASSDWFLSQFDSDELSNMGVQKR